MFSKIRSWNSLLDLQLFVRFSEKKCQEEQSCDVMDNRAIVTISSDCNQRVTFKLNLAVGINLAGLLLEMITHGICDLIEGGEIHFKQAHKFYRSNLRNPKIDVLKLSQE